MTASPRSLRGAGGGGRRQAGVDAAAAAERRRRLEEFLAAKGKLRPPSARPYLKDKTNQQTAAPFKPDPAARKDQRRVAPNKSKNGPIPEAVPAGPILPAGASCTAAARKPQTLGSCLPRKGPAPPLPSKPPAKSHSGRQSSRGPSTGRPLSLARKSEEWEWATAPSNAHGKLSVGVCHRKAAGSKANAAGVMVVRPGQKRVFSLLAESSTTPERSTRKSRRAVERDAHGNGQARPGQGKPRQLPGGSWGSVHHSSAARPFPQPDRPTIISRPAVKSQGPNSKVAKQSGAPWGGGTLSARGSSGVLPEEGSKRPADLCPALPCGRQPSNSREPRRTPRLTAQGSQSAVPGGIDQSRSAAKRKQSSQRPERLPRTCKTKSRPPGSACHTAPAAGGSQRGWRGAPKSRQPAVGAASRAPRTPSPQDRRRLLEAWLVSRGKRCKRPSVPRSAPKPPKGKANLNRSFWGPLEKGERGKEQLHVASKITSTLAECRKLAEEGFPSEELLAVLSRIPQVERFAQFWICKAKLQARQGALDVPGLYEAALRAGAAPLQELRDGIAGILGNAGEPARACPACASLGPEEEEEEAAAPWSRWQGSPWPLPPLAIKLKVLPLPRAKERSAWPGMKLLTPVRRSLRIQSAAACYPQMLKDQDPVVSSLAEIMATDHRSQFVFRSNEALPGGVELASFVTGL